MEIIAVAALDELSSKECLFQSRLPSLTRREQKEICGCADFLAVTYFNSRLVRYTAEPAPHAADGTFYTPDARLEYSKDPSWPVSAIPSFYSIPAGTAFVLQWVS